jgi:hypothetical protein
MQPKPVVINHGHSCSETVYMVRIVHRVRHVSNSREAPGHDSDPRLTRHNICSYSLEEAAQ